MSHVKFDFPCTMRLYCTVCTVVHTSGGGLPPIYIRICFLVSCLASKLLSPIAYVFVACTFYIYYREIFPTVPINNCVRNITNPATYSIQRYFWRKYFNLYTTFKCHNASLVIPCSLKYSAHLKNSQNTFLRMQTQYNLVHCSLSW